MGSATGASRTSTWSATPRRRYTGAHADVPIEGLPGLFENLRLCCDLADQVVLLSEYERDFLAALGARIDQAVIIRNGIDAAAMRGGDPEVFRKRFGLERYLLCVGRLEYRKNQALAALAVRDSAAPLVLVGAVGDPGYVDHVRRLGERNVRVLDRIEDRAMLASAYAGASAFVFPSWTEGAPLAAMEAAAAGTPLILGEMSSEQEHFGADAQYVHPRFPRRCRATRGQGCAIQRGILDRAPRRRDLGVVRAAAARAVRYPCAGGGRFGAAALHPGRTAVYGRSLGRTQHTARARRARSEPSSTT